MAKEDEEEEEEGGVSLNSIDTCNVRVHIKPHSTIFDQGEASKPLVVHAQSHILCTIPYFAARLSQVWQGQDNIDTPAQSNPRHFDLALECVPSTSPEDYLLCLQFLNPHDANFKLPSTVDCALKVLRSADHLLYQECAEVCMAYLAAKVWSEEEEACIRMAISTIGLKLSSDLATKLQVSESFENVHILKDVLLHLAQNAYNGNSAISALQDLVKQVIAEAPPPVVQMSASYLMEAWMCVSDKLIRGSDDPKERMSKGPRTWCALTSVLLLYKDAKELLHAFVLKSKELSEVMHRVSFWIRESDFEDILSRLFLRVVPGKDEDLVLLSTSQRACLVAAWTPLVGKLDHAGQLSSALQDIISTLPVQDPSLVALVKNEAGKEYFQQCYKWWRTQLVKRMRVSDIHHADVEVINEEQVCLSGGQCSQMEL